MHVISLSFRQRCIWSRRLSASCFYILVTIQMYNLNKSLWIKASAKCINVNVTQLVDAHLTHLWIRIQTKRLGFHTNEGRFYWWSSVCLLDRWSKWAQFKLDSVWQREKGSCGDLVFSLQPARCKSAYLSIIRSSRSSLHENMAFPLRSSSVWVTYCRFREILFI